MLHFSKVMGGTGGGASFNAKYSDFYVAVARGVNQILNASRREGGRWQQKRGKNLKSAIETNIFLFFSIYT